MRRSPGDRIGKYRVDGQIGAGPHGCVYAATIDGRNVALKVFEARAPSAQALAALRGVAHLEHPNVAGVVEVGEADGRLYVAREHVFGDALATCAAAAPRHARLAWLVALARALEVAHRRGVAHGAIHARNVIVEDDGTPKLTDFGAGDAPGDEAGDRRAFAALARELLEEAAAPDSVRASLREVERAASFDVIASALEAALVVSGEVEPHAASVEREAVHSPSAMAPDSVRAPSRASLLLAAIATALVMWVAFRARIAPQAAPAARAPATTDASASASPAAALFAGAMQSMRDASIEQARATFDEALRADASYAPAHLRRALISVFVDEEAREHFARAVSLRSALDAHERVLLDAFEPAMRSEPAYDETLARMQRAVEQAPNDADYAYYLGVARWFTGDLPGVTVEMARALRLDPQLALASRARAYALLFSDDVSGARDEYERCLSISPAATKCLEDLAGVQEREGDCAAAAATSRRAISVNPQSSSAYYTLALALSAQHDDEAAALALAQSVARLPAARRPARSVALDVQRAILRGDFVAAEQALDAWEALLFGESDEWSHYSPIEPRMEIAMETGRPREAVVAGERFLARRAAWTGTAYVSDPTLLVLGVMKRAGGVAPGVLEGQRRIFEESFRTDAGAVSMVSRLRREKAWIWAYLTAIASPMDAREALEARRRYPALMNVGIRHPIEIDGMLGRTFHLAGRDDEAVAPLERSARSCLALESPLFHTQLLLLLADVRRAQGSKDAACPLYREVLARWGTARPPSQTAMAAKLAVAALACP